ncbi:MAG: DnaB-like helicase C-terminal domain-containing protein [Spirochaetota bacterium]
MMEILELRNDGEAKGVIPSGIHALDAILGGGLRQGNVILFASRPGSGKTSLAIDIAYYAALNTFKPVCFCSAEMSIAELSERFRSRTAGNCLNDHPVLHLHDSIRTVADVEAAGTGNTPGLIVIDYIQLLKTGNEGTTDSPDLSAVSLDIKRLAKRLNIPIIVLSQLPRSRRDRPDERHDLGDLLVYGKLEMNTDDIVFLYRDDTAQNAAMSEAELRVFKNRNARRLGTVKLYFDVTNAMFYNANPWSVFI